MTRETDERTRATRERFRALSERLSDAELARPIDPPWTAAGLMAHVAFWDRFVHARWRLATDGESPTPKEIDQVRWI